MNIVVCVKQVPDTTDIKVDPETGTLKRETAGTTINPFDVYAIEEGLRLKERLGGGKVTIMTMGPPAADKILKIGIGMGCDEAVLVTDRKVAGSDTWATSYVVAQACKKLEANIILFGKQAIDGDTAQVGPSTAEYLGMPQITWVKEIKEVSDTEITAVRMMEDGVDIVKSSLPVCITVVKDINEPRLESLKGKMRAKKYEVPQWTLEDIDGDYDNVGLKASPTKVHKTWSPVMDTGAAEMLSGEPEEMADKVIDKLKDGGLLI